MEQVSVTTTVVLAAPLPNLPPSNKKTNPLTNINYIFLHCTPFFHKQFTHISHLHLSHNFRSLHYIHNPTQEEQKKMSHHESSTIHIQEPKSEPRGKFGAMKAVKVMGSGGGAVNRGLAVFDFILRLAALAAALGAAIAMGTSDQTLNFFTQFFQFHARYDDLPAFSFFVAANAVASAYLVLSLPFSIVSIVRPQALGVRMLLIIFDTIAVALISAGAGAAAAIVYLAHKGNNKINWGAICQQFGSFCERVSGAVVASFIAAFLFIVLVLISAASLRRN